MLSSKEEQMLILIEGLRNPDKEHRARCTNDIAEYGATAVPILIPFLQDEDWIVRYRVAEALGMIQIKEGVHPLISACDDPKDHVRYMAAKSLGKIRDPDAVPVLIQLLNDTHPYTRGISSDNLATMKDYRAKIPLEKALNRETNPEIKERIRKNLILLE